MGSTESLADRNDQGELSFRIIVNRGLLPDPLIPESWRLRCRNLRRRLVRWLT